MPAECCHCENQVEPVSAPVVDGRIKTDNKICAYELDGLLEFEPRGDVELVNIAYFCPICRHVFENARPDLTWLWKDWSGIPVVVDESPPPRLGIE